MNGLRGEITGTNLEGNLFAPVEKEWPHKWPDGIVTYRLTNLSLDIEKKEWQERAVTVAFRVWGLRVKDIKFKRVYDSEAPVDIPISFEPLSVFDGKKGVLAHATYPGQSTMYIHINDEWNWVPATKWQRLSQPPMVPILIHEIGHALGLRHDTLDVESIMYPSFDLGKEKNKLGPRDIDRIQGKAGFIGYGARTLSQRLIDYFIKRRTDGRDYR